MSKIVFKRGGTTIEMSDTLERMVTRALDDMDDALLQSVRKDVQAVKDAAYDAWPVKTGKSKAALQVLSTIDEAAGEVRVSVVDDVVYGKFIKANSLNGKSAFVELLRKPMNKATKAIAEHASKAAKASLEG